MTSIGKRIPLLANIAVQAISVKSLSIDQRLDSQRDRTLSNTEAPFSGIKNSGYGYEGGSDGLSSYLHCKSVHQA